MSRPSCCGAISSRKSRSARSSRSRSSSMSRCPASPCGRCRWRRASCPITAAPSISSSIAPGRCGSSCRSRAAPAASRSLSAASSRAWKWSSGRSRADPGRLFAMSHDDPFSAGSEKTVIRPNPGGRRAAAPGQAPMATPAAAARMGDAPAAALPAVGANVLVSAAAPLLSLAVRLRGTASLANIEALRERVVQEIRNFERLVSGASLPREALRGAHYAICATIDDVITNTPWGSGAAWARQSMCSVFHNDVAGGERFFEFLTHFEREPGRYGDVLELMYLCLSLGFEGRLRVAQRGVSELGRVREGLYNLLRQIRGDFDRTLSPHWRGLEAPHRALSSVLPSWVVGLGVAAVLTVVFVVLSYVLNGMSDRVFDRFATLPPVGPVSIAVAAPAPPPVVRDDLQQRLSKFLAKEI